MTLADLVIANVAKLRDLQTTSSETGDEWIDEADVLRIAADLEHAARQPCEGCATYEMVLDLCVASLPSPARYGEVPGWIDLLCGVVAAARELRKWGIDPDSDEIGYVPLDTEENARDARDALDAALAKLEER